jgi:glutathione S-transferase
MLRLSPKGTVPVLHLGGGMVLDESLEIMKWALAQRDPLHWLRGCDQPAFADIIAENDDSFKKQLDRYKYPQRYALPDGAEARKAAGTILYAWEQRLRAHDHLLSQAPTMVDAAIFPFVRQFAAVDSPWFAQAFPALERWRERWDSSSLMQRVMVKI